MKNKLDIIFVHAIKNGLQERGIKDPQSALQSAKKIMGEQEQWLEHIENLNLNDDQKIAIAQISAAQVSSLLATRRYDVAQCFSSSMRMVNEYIPSVKRLYAEAGNSIEFKSACYILSAHLQGVLESSTKPSLSDAKNQVMKKKESHLRLARLFSKSASTYRAKNSEGENNANMNIENKMKARAVVYSSIAASADILNKLRQGNNLEESLSSIYPKIDTIYDKSYKYIIAARKQNLGISTLSAGEKQYIEKIPGIKEEVLSKPASFNDIMQERRCRGEQPIKKQDRKIG